MGMRFEITKTKYMGRIQKIILLFVIFMAYYTLNIKAQSTQIDFKYDKSVKDSSKIEIQVKIVEGDGPFKYIIYQGDLLDNGVSLKEEETSLLDFSIIVEKKPNLYLYVANLSNGKPKCFKIVPLK